MFLLKNYKTIIYIGKAGATNSSAIIQSRLKQYFNFGQSKPLGHWGGRYIWQLNNSSDLIVCWEATPENEPSVVESFLIKKFKEFYGQRPFANLKD